jgi:hypothetical protein
MAKRSEKTTSTIGKQTPEQKRILDAMGQRMDAVQGQFGDLTDLAAGNMQQLSPEVEQAIKDAQQFARLNIDENFEQGMRDQQLSASQRGISGSTAEQIGSTLLGRERSNQLSQLDSSAANMRLQLPFQLAQQQMGANQLLSQMFSGIGSSFASGGAFGAGGLFGGSSNNITKG